MTPDQERLLNEVHEAVVGNSNTGNKGLVSRMDAVEGKIFKLSVSAASLYSLVEGIRFFHH